MKKFGPEEISNQTIMKSSMQRAVRAQILQEYPRLEPVMEEIWPKKAAPVLLKCQNRISVVALNGKPLFFQSRDRQWVPTLRLLHECEFPQTGAEEKLVRVPLCSCIDCRIALCFWCLVLRCRPVNDAENAGR